MQISRALNDFARSMALGTEIHSAAQQPAAVCQPDCPICHGAGWTRADVPVGYPSFGKLVLCPNLAPRFFASRSGLTEKELAADFDSIVPGINNAGDAVEAVQDVLARGTGWVYLWGAPGLAKTVILKAAVAQAVRLGTEAIYTRMVEVIDNLRASFEAPEGEEGRRIDRWSRVPVLAVDEFDRVRSTEYASERRFLLLDRRYEDACRGGSVTILASNSDPRLLEDYLSSRIFDGRFRVVRLEGSDARPMMKNRSDYVDYND